MRTQGTNALDASKLLPLYHEAELKHWTMTQYWAMADLLDIVPLARNAGVRPEDLIITVPDESVCSALYLAGQHGFSEFGGVRMDSTTVADRVARGAKYLYVLGHDTAVTGRLDGWLGKRILEHGEVSIYDLRRVPLMERYRRVSSTAAQRLFAWAGSSKGVWWCALAFFLFFLSASWRDHAKIPLDDWRSDLRADAAGYYIYLPGLLHHGMRAAAVKDSVVELAGNGYSLDRERDRIVTKYTYGTALLMAPFFLAAELVEGFGNSDGWSRTHHQAMEVAGLFYWTIALVLLALALRRWQPTGNGVALLVLGCVAFGTNTFYYAYRYPAFSHVYSFFLVALSFYAIHADGRAPMRRAMRWLFIVANALIVVVRPIDGLAVLALYALLWVARPGLLLSWRLYGAQAVLGVLFAGPQLLYWKFVHGSWLFYSYGEEGFTHWAEPKWMEVLFSPHNGTLPYAPAFLLLPFGIAVLFVRARATAWTLSLLLLFVVYSCAAWHAFHFGCAFGMRPLVQYTPFLAIALWSLFTWMGERWRSVGYGAAPLLVLVCFVNYRMMLEFEACYMGDDHDWLPFGRTLFQAFFGRAPF
ncbi:MAG: hypothetical protein IPK99_10440 [Flavobacteriales bacterium]|nr:hypothetical protein [Flavobacteriales bacterium]